MSRITDVSGKLGEYMLKGWILSDEICSRDGCPVPLMRSPQGHVPPTTFCANCDGDPQSKSKLPTAASIEQPSPSVTHSSVSHSSRSSTPPTDISAAPSSPTFALPVDSAESIRRRQQSDAASAEIGKRLLRGWAMLADECPNSSCYGVPLVRPPRAGGRDPRKECVVCHRTYVGERDAQSLEQQQTHEDSTRIGDVTLTPSAPLESPTALPSQNTARTMVPDTHAISPAPQDALRLHGLSKTSRPRDVPPQQTAVMAATTSLEHALQGLSQRMASLTSNQSLMDPGSIAVTADAMGKVLQALVHAKQLCE